jgi:phosphosulfolactate phosphohydrolase-like enzyme
LLAALHKNKSLNNNDQAAITALMQSEQAQLEIIASAFSNIAEAHKEHMPLVVDFGQYLMSQVRELMTAVEDFLSSARIELGLEGESEVLRQQTIAMYERAKLAVAEATAQGHAKQSR